MRENRTCGSEGGEAQSLPYPYHRDQAPLLRGGLVDDLLGDLEVVGDGWLVLAGAGLQEFVHGE